MGNKINIEDLPESQQVYVREYQRILHGLADVQDSIKDLETRAHRRWEPPEPSWQGVIVACQRLSLVHRGNISQISPWPVVGAAKLCLWAPCHR